MAVPSACSNCQQTSFEEGFFGDAGQGSRGYLSWVEGALELGILGNAKGTGKDRFAVEAFRCKACGHLTLFANEPARRR